MCIHLILLLSALLSSVHGLQNVTIDDPDASIVYAPTASWSVSASNALNVGGSHRLTQDTTATATFTFTGVAIYFMSPRWPYLVNTAVSLDSAPPVLLDLVDHSRPNTGQGPETVQSQVIWGAAGLSNTQHKLVISVGAGQPFAIVDALIFTALDPSDQTTTTSSATTTSSSSTSKSSTTSSATTTAGGASTSTPTSSSSNHVLPIVLGTVLGLLALVIIAVLVWFCNRRKKRPISEAWTVAGQPYPGSPPMSAVPLASNDRDSYGGNYQSSMHNGWNPYNYNHTTFAPIPGAMSPATAASLAHPYAIATPIHDNDNGPITTTQIAQLYNRAPNRYQPNTLSTITETSTPRGTPLAHSPSSNQTDISYYDAQEDIPERRSLPPSEGRSGSSTHTAYTGANQDFLNSQNMVPTVRNMKRPQPPAYTPQ